MAIQQLTQPIINPIAAFDATQNHVVTFLAIGGAQVVGNRIVISDNQTGETIYDNRVITMQLAHTIPANTLTNGGYYNVVIYTIDSANNFSQASVPVPFYCYSQPTLTINNIPASSTIENGTYTFQGSYAQQENEILNSYQFILYDSNKTVLSQSDVIYYSSNDSLSYTFVGMSNDTSYYIELKGQTVNSTEITTGLLYFTVRYSQPASFAIVDLVNDCENGFIQISSNIVAIDGKSNPEPPIYIDNKEVDLREPDSWVRWDEGFNIKDDFTMRVWGRDFNDFEPIITLSNKNNTDSEPNKIEMKWMIADVMKILPDYTLISGKNISIVDGYKTDINDLAIYGNSEQIKKDSIDFGTANSMTIDTTEYMFLDIDVYGNQYQATREGYNLGKYNVGTKTVNGVTFTHNEDDSMTINGTPIGYIWFDMSDGVLLKAGTYTFAIEYYNLASGDDQVQVINKTLDKTIKSLYATNTVQSNKKVVEFTLEEDAVCMLRYYCRQDDTINNQKLYAMILNGSYTVDTLPAFEPYGAMPSPEFPSEIVTVGQNVNIIDYTKLTSFEHIYLTVTQIANGIRVTCNTTTPHLTSKYILINLEKYKGKNLTISANIKSSSSNRGMVLLAFCDSNGGNRSDSTYTEETTDGKVSLTKAIPETLTDNTSYLCLMLYGRRSTYDDTQVGEYVDYTEIKLVEGTEVGGYSPYGQGSVEISVDNGLETTDTNYQSYTKVLPIQKEMLDGDYIEDVEHHGWGKYEITGNEVWRKSSNSKNISYFLVANSMLVNIDTKTLSPSVSDSQTKVAIVLSNYFKAISPNQLFVVGENGICLNLYNNEIQMRLGFGLDSDINTVDKLKAWLKSLYDAGTPVIVYYKLATPKSLELTEEQKTVKNTLINAYEPITNVYASDDLSLLKVYTTPIPSPKLPSKIYSSGDKKNQLKDLGIINIDYTQGYFETTDTDFILKPDFVYNLSFDYIVNNTTTDLYFTVSYKSNGEIFDITNASQYTNKTTGRNNISFIVPADIPANSTLSIKFARTIIQADVSVSVNNVALVKERFAADYQSPDIYNIYPTVTQKNIFNYNDIYYIKNQNATLTFIQNGFSSEVVTTGEKSFFEFGFPNILQPGNKYAISYNSYGAIKSAKIYTMDKETGKTLEQIVTKNGVFTAPSNLYDIKAEFVLDDSVADNQVQVWNIQLESGEQVSEAETYTANSTDLTLEQPLRGIGDYRDLACLESPNILNPETQTAIVKGSTTYSLSQSGTTAYKFDYINEDNNIISSENMASGQFTTPDNCIRIKFDTTSDIITTNKLQVNLGNTAMVYYPYVNEPSVIRHISERILDGSPGHSFLSKHSTIYTSERGFYSLQLPNATEKGYSTVNYGICNYLTYIKGTAAQAIYKTGLWWEGGNTHINYASIPFTTLNKANQWLTDLNNKGNPLTIEYVLNNPIVEPLSSDNILALQNLKTYEGISNVFANNSMPANLNLSYISGQSKQETKNAYVTLKCWNSNAIPYFIHSNYIDIPKETDKVFIWLRRKNNIFDLKIENLGDYEEDKPGNKGNPQVAITVDNTTTTTITITANTIDTATLSNVKFSKDNGATWDAEIPLDGLSSTDTYTFTGLQPAITYQIRVETTNVNGITGGITQQVITRAS